jgi:hypothetical protein
MKTDCFFENAFQVSYDGDERVEFIECARSGLFKIMFDGQALQEITAEEAMDCLRRVAASDEKTSEPGYSYIFPAIDVSLWRGVLPQAGDNISGRHFEAVGVGKKGYFNLCGY